MKYFFLLSVCIPAFFFAGCNVINPVEVTPTYVYLDSMNFEINDALKEGSSASQKITSAWVYLDNNIVGVFELPAKVPLMMTNASGQVRVAPGVTYSGLSQQSLYPFFMADTFTISRTEGQVTHPIPTVSYASDTKFPFREDFETGNTFISLTDIETDTTIVRTDDKSKIFEGGGSGYIYVDGTHSTSENVSTQGFAIAQGNSFVELNYKCNTSFQIGLLTTYLGNIKYQYVGGVLARENWNKIYIDLSKFTGTYPSSSYRLIIKTGLDEGLSTGYVLLDNIKVLSF